MQILRVNTNIHAEIWILTSGHNREKYTAYNIHTINTPRRQRHKILQMRKLAKNNQLIVSMKVQRIQPVPLKRRHY